MLEDKVKALVPEYFLTHPVQGQVLVFGLMAALAFWGWRTGNRLLLIMGSFYCLFALVSVGLGLLFPS